MNRNKISKSILNQVNILSGEKLFDIVLMSNNFLLTKKLLDEKKFHYTAYRFANCFSLPLRIDDLDFLSEQKSISFLFNNEIVLAEKYEKDFIHLDNLTNGKEFAYNQTICFIDTGIYPHFDFIFPKNRIVKFIDLINHKQYPYDDNGHGTFVAGICSSNGIFCKSNSGFARLSNIIMIKALSKDGSSNSNIILDAMQWIYENHKKYNINIVCMSFGADSIENNDPLSKGAEALWKIGLTIVAAGGNSGPKQNTIKSPGNSPDIITVGALDSEKMTIAEFSSRGPTRYGNKPDLVAPAVNLTSCSCYRPFYSSMSGTSVATPIIAGICAQIKGKYPYFSNYEIKQFLLKNCKPITRNKNLEGAGFIKF